VRREAGIVEHQERTRPGRKRRRGLLDHLNLYDAIVLPKRLSHQDRALRGGGEAEAASRRRPRESLPGELIELPDKKGINSQLEVTVQPIRGASRERLACDGVVKEGGDEGGIQAPEG